MINPVYGKSYTFEFPGNYDIEEMDLIDIRRKIMKWCAKSQGAIGPCRNCESKCSAGIKALELYDGINAVVALEPSAVKHVINSVVDKEPEEKIKEESVEMKDKKKPVSKWYEEAESSGDPVKWCVDNLGITVQQAKKRIYMYEYNRGLRRSTKEETVLPVMKTDSGLIAKTETESSLIDAMRSEMEMLTRKQKEYKAQIDDLTSKHEKISDRIEAISMCIELYKDKLTL